MQDILNQARPVFRELTYIETRPNFRLFIACEDQAAFQEAKKLHDQVKSLCGDQVEIVRVFWNFSLLRHEQLRDCASKEAADAEMVVIAFRGDLPEHVRTWLETLPTNDRDGQAALVALITPSEERDDDPQSTIGELERFADSRGMDFFCNKEDWERLECFQTPFAEVEEAFKTFSRCNFISFQVPWSTGGINE